MQRRVVSVPDLILIASTRVALGVGIGLLLSKKLREEAREGAGVALLAIGALTTIPLFMKVRSASQPGVAEEATAQPWMRRQTARTSEIHSPS